MKQIQINLLSDMCSSSGENYGVLIDTDICYDKYGFPYIPAKRIKGCLRDICKELVEWGEFDGQVLVDIFGQAGGQSVGDLKISDAKLDKYEEMQNEIINAKEENKVFYHKQNILDCFTYVRVQTKLIDGVAENNSLRSTRVVKRGTKFIFEYSLSEKYQPYFEKCVAGLRNIGMNRTRGFGEVKLELMENNKINTKNNLISYIFKDDTDYEISYKILAESNMLFPKPDGGDTKTESYIPGSNLLGFIAKKYSDDNGQSGFAELFIDGNIRFQNAYISDGKTRFIPVPASFNKVKDMPITDDSECFDKLRYQPENNNDNNKTVQTQNIGEKYISAPFGDIIQIMSVNTEVGYHHRRSVDNEENKDFYQFASISVGQVFIGKICGKGKYLSRILPYIQNNSTVYLGKSKTAQYGRGLLYDVEIFEANNKNIETDSFVVLLTSPAVLLNDKLLYSADINTLIAEIEQHLNSKVKVKMDNDKSLTFLRYKTVGGYNGKWNLQKNNAQAFDSGTVCVFEMECERDISKLNNINIGERSAEGFGEIMVYPYNCVRETIRFNNVKEDIEQNKEYEITKDSLLTQIVKRLEKIELEKLAIEQAKNNKEKILPNATTVGRLFLMNREQITLDSFVESMNEIKDNKKCNKVFKLLFDFDIFRFDNSKERFSLEELKKKAKEFLCYQAKEAKVSILKIDEMYNSYVKALLTQAKFEIRQEGVKENAN